jgi:hypothetical protein
METESSTAEKVSSVEVFNEVLLELYGRGKDRFKYDMINWHKVFYTAKQEFPETMKSFDVLKRTNPYLHDIQECFHWFMMAGHLSQIVPDGDYLINKPERLESTFDRKPEVQEVARYICDRL